MGLTGERPESDFDTEKLGIALIEFSKEYRSLKPQATLAEAADEFFKRLKQVSLYNNLLSGPAKSSL